MSTKTLTDAELEDIARDRCYQPDAERNAHVQKILNTPLGFIGQELAAAEGFFAAQLKSFTDTEEGSANGGCQECGLQREDAAVALRMIRGERYH